MSDPIVSAEELSCFYGLVLGLNNVSFEIPPGITGLVGPNGAGKSTLIKLITGQLVPSSGRLSVFGETPRNNPRVLGQLGYCPEREQLPKELRPIAWLRSLASVSGTPWRETQALAEQALERARLDKEHWKKRMGTYSKGMKQRVKLAQALMHGPRAIVLDEPMNGLDPMGRAAFGEILKELREQGTSVLVSSHILHELEFLCSGFVILNWGRVLASGSQMELRKTVVEWSDEISIRCSDPNRLAAHLQAQGLLRGFLADGQDLTVWVRQPERFLADWPEHFAGCDCQIFEMKNKNLALSSIFERMTR